MKTKNGRSLLLLNIILPIIVIVGAAALLLQNYLYNNKERVYQLADAERTETEFIFDDITIKLAPRAGDSGSWASNYLKDKNGTLIYLTAIGTIYEAEIINTSQDTVTDWTFKLNMPEEMYVNNTWNGDFEYHQFFNAEEKIQSLNLAQYSRYDIKLMHWMTPSGAMIRLLKDDFFIYHPNDDLGENSIVPERNNSVGGVKVGFIMYTPHDDIGYVIDFSSGEFKYHLHRSITKNPFFWVLGGLAVVWFSCLISTIIIRVNLKRYEEQKNRDRKTIEQTMQTFVNFIEAKDPSTMGHSLRVAQYSKMLAQKLNFSELECDQIYWIALMHDCGKLYIPDEILGKPGRLTDEEYEIMKKHTTYGSEILRDFTAIDNIRMGALCHHERFDGKGYPNGMAGEEIPMIGRIICASDAFDAMNSRRCYRESLPMDYIIDELQSNKGKQFDPQVIDCLLSLIASGDIGFTNTSKNKKNDD
ncbi:MAG: HD-GYP domain-containing protein [Oscillospiraceae bacterium]|nr:HD-GYP domain-containing protein [Oscillospiraceae bacterium]